MAHDDPLTGFLTRLFTREGGRSNHVSDRGGETAYGISKRAFPEVWANGPPTREDAERVYRTVFYTSPGIDQIPDLHLREQVFDFGVNAGPKQAVQLLQLLLGVVADGVLGPETLKKLHAYPAGVLYGVTLPPMVNLNLAYETARVAYYAKLVQKDPAQAVFLRGWQSRATSLRVLA